MGLGFWGGRRAAFGGRLGTGFSFGLGLGVLGRLGFWGGFLRLGGFEGDGDGFGENYRGGCFCFRLGAWARHGHNQNQAVYCHCEGDDHPQLH